MSVHLLETGSAHRWAHQMAKMLDDLKGVYLGLPWEYRTARPSVR